MKEEMKDKICKCFKVGAVVGEKSAMGKIKNTDGWSPGHIVKDDGSRKVSDTTSDDNVKDSKNITTASVG